MFMLRGQLLLVSVKGTEGIMVVLSKRAEDICTVHNMQHRGAVGSDPVITASLSLI